MRNSSDRDKNIKFAPVFKLGNLPFRLIVVVFFASFVVGSATSSFILYIGLLITVLIPFFVKLFYQNSWYQITTDNIEIHHNYFDFRFV